MKSQPQNKGSLKPLNVNIEIKVVEMLEKMSSQTKIPLDDLVVTALKRFISSHSDFVHDRPVDHHLNKK
jgi:hypothetical protein